MFCENETNRIKLFGNGMNAHRYTKDGINDHIVHRAKDAVSNRHGGTKVGFRYRFAEVAPGRASPYASGSARTRPRTACSGPTSSRR